MAAFSERPASRPESGSQASPPSISLPKGGGAIRGIGEKFSTNPATGTASLSVPLALSPGRSGFGPRLSLSYDSGAGNGPFGLGWGLSLPAITRKTDKGIPRYRDSEESDIYVLSGAEDLVAVFRPDGTRSEDRTTNPGFVIHRYRPRIEGLFAIIERWTSTATGEIHWRTINRDNVTTLYGKDDNSRVSDPADPTPAHPTRVFSWLICQSYDDKGNAIAYEYVAENDDNIDQTLCCERNRLSGANRYLKRIRYGNREPNRDPASWRARDASELPGQTWMFEAVFDYGEGHYQENAPDARNRIHARGLATPPVGSRWPVRQDPFSTYRAGFEVRTRRLCRRVLMFHHFPEELGIDDCLVRSTEFFYVESPVASFIQSVSQSGFVRQPVQERPDRYLKRSLPPLEFEYSQAPRASELARRPVRDVDLESLENLPAGLADVDCHWVDLDGEGLPGFLVEKADVWYYKPNLSANNQLAESVSTSATAARFGPARLVASKPVPGLASGAQLLDLAGDGQVDLVQFQGPLLGFYERTESADWTSFRPFVAWPDLDTRDANLRFIDLTGDGRADILIAEGETLLWYPSLAEQGFGPALRVSLPAGEDRGPRLVFSDGERSIHLADLSGDGMSDLVRIRNGEICYWPNLGHGRFGAKVTMDGAPRFDTPDLFDPGRLRLVDSDGSGTTDILYLGRDGARIYFNQSGNGWSKGAALPLFPSADNLSTIRAFDLLANGTACVVWSSPLASAGPRTMRYVQLMDEKPHLLVGLRNNLGAETRVEYAPSTKFYLNDKALGRPWVTRLPFPVQVVERVETDDRVSGNRFVTRYAYHHGHFDGEEREFRGFAMVEQWDTEEFSALVDNGELDLRANLDATSHVPPTLTKTWFHTGLFLGRDRVSNFFAGLLDSQDLGEYFREPGLTDAQARALLLPDTVLPMGLDPSEERDACRALRGFTLRKELYALDGAAGEKLPYTVEERNFSVKRVQAGARDRRGVFLTHPREVLSFYYERAFAFDPTDPEPDLERKRKLLDPRVTHDLTLQVDRFGNILDSVSIAYGRRGDAPDPRLTSSDREIQRLTQITHTRNRFTNAVGDIEASPQDYRAPLLAETQTHELRKPRQETSGTGLTQVFPFETVRDLVEQTGDGNHDIPFEDWPFAKAAETASERPEETGKYFRRSIERVRKLFRKDDLTALLPLGGLEPLALPGETYKLAFTPGLLAGLFRRDGEVLLPSPGAVVGGPGPDRGGYVDLDGDGRWWAPSGREFLSPDPGDTPAQELDQARRHFFLPHRCRNPFHTAAASTESFVAYDRHSLLILETRDPFGSRLTVGERLASGEIDPDKPGNDYRTLQPKLLMDPNRNRSAVAFDGLGLVAGTAVMGKPEQDLGDSLDGFDPDLDEPATIEHFRNPLANPNSLLARATTRMVYDQFAYLRTRGGPRPKPSMVSTLSRETHDKDLSPGETSRIRIGFSYSDGFGREIQKKIEAEPGRVPLRDGNGAVIVGPDGQPTMTADKVSPRWVGSGWTVFNNKGKPVRRYEPFFTDTHRFEFDVRIGVSPVLFYDPVQRVVATLHPNHTWEKVVFEPWRQETWDVNDTLLGDPRTDSTAGPFFRRLADSEYLPTWRSQRIGGGLGEDERDAAVQTAVHAETPRVAHLDSLGRAFLTIAHNRFRHSDAPFGSPPSEEFHSTRVHFDIAGNHRACIDPSGGLAMSYDYDMAGNRIHLANMDAGRRWTLADAAGKPLRAWDSRGRRLRFTYDPLRRPADLFLQAGAEPEKLVERRIHGETLANPETGNLRGKVVQVFDQAGTVVSDEFDFKGNQRRSQRRLAESYATVLDWSGPVPLQPETFTTRTSFDALNRPLQFVPPHGDQPGSTVNVVQPVFNEANLLEKIDVWLQRANDPARRLDPLTADMHVITNVDYNARGQRELVEYGNGVTVSRRFDLQTFRLAQLNTTRTQDNTALQDLSYTYDPVGNITRIRDDAQQTVYFRNRRVEPSCGYLYDSIYRLIEATGRESLGAVDGPPIPGSYNDAPRIGLVHPGDGNALGLYLERYLYDAVGNLQSIEHRGSDPVNPGWTRTYAYGEASRTEPGKFGNRLTSTNVGPAAEIYSVDGDGYDAHGNMLRLPHLQAIEWDFRDQLRMTRRQAVDAGDAEGAQRQGERTWYVYDFNGRRARKVTESEAGQIKEERIYLGGFELYRRNGLTSLERETLHVMESQQRVALIETRTKGIDSAPPQAIRYQFGNHLGSVSLELDEAAKIASYEEFTPYGSTSYQAVGLTGIPKRHRYAGAERDRESGFDYREARYFAPWLGRWVSPDPQPLTSGTTVFSAAGRDRANAATEAAGRGGQKGVGESGLPGQGRASPGGAGGWPLEMTDGPNLYAYARDNPIAYHDPTGRQAAKPPEAAPAASKAEPGDADSRAQGKSDTFWAKLFQAFNAILTFAATILVGGLIGGPAGLAIGAVLGFAHVFISAVGQDPKIRQSETYKDVLGATSWLNPMALLATAFGLIVPTINLAFLILSFGAEPARFDVSFYHGMLLISGGVIRPERARTSGNIIHVDPNEAGVKDPQTREFILRHEWGHSLNNAMFGLFQLEDPFVENLVGQRYSFFERLAESNVNPNRTVKGDYERKDERRIEGGRGFGEVPWWNP